MGKVIQRRDEISTGESQDFQPPQKINMPPSAERKKYLKNKQTEDFTKSPNKLTLFNLNTRSTLEKKMPQ